MTDDYYYFVLTNNNFVFGQDWICSVMFAETFVTPTVPLPAVQADDKVVQKIIERLQAYFNTITFDIEERSTMDAEYINACSELFAQFDDNIINAVSPLLLVDTLSPKVVFDKSVTLDEQYLLVGLNWHSHDANFKLLASNKMENALVISAALPLQKYRDTAIYLPLFYVFTYEKHGKPAIDTDSFMFIYGHLLSFSEVEAYKVYEDDQYVCYEMSDFIYSDLIEYAYSFVSQNADIRFDEQVQERVKNIYDYYKENMGNLFYYK